MDYVKRRESSLNIPKWTIKVTRFTFPRKMQAARGRPGTGRRSHHQLLGVPAQAGVLLLLWVLGSNNTSCC